MNSGWLYELGEHHLGEMDMHGFHTQVFQSAVHGSGY